MYKMYKEDKNCWECQQKKCKKYLLSNSIKNIWNDYPKDGSIVFIEDLMKDTHSIIKERLSKEKELDPSLQEIMSKAMGGSKRKTKRGCKGKRNGTDGCRKCCKTKRKYNKCLKRCMNY